MNSVPCTFVLPSWMSLSSRNPLQTGRGGHTGNTDPAMNCRSRGIRMNLHTPARRTASIKAGAASKQPNALLSVDADTGFQTMGEMDASRRRDYDPSDYVNLLPDFLKEDEGPPRWFCPVRKGQQTPFPLMLFLPGIAGSGVELFLQYQVLGRLFELQCLHIPIMDRTPFEGLVRLVGEYVCEEVGKHPNRPIYLVGDNFGGTLALAVAAQNPTLDLVLVLVNPATSFHKSTLQPFLPFIQALPPQMFMAAPYFLSLLLTDTNLFQSSKSGTIQPPFDRVQQVFDQIFGFVTTMPKVSIEKMKEVVLRKLQLLDSSAKEVNEELYNVKADVLVLVSGKDELLPSLDEARRLSKLLPKCTFRNFEQSGHLLLLDGNIDLATVLKGTGMYRTVGTKDLVANFVPPTEEEITNLYESTRLLRRLTSPIFLSTGEDGKVTQGLSMIPSRGPIIFVGNHSFMGLDMKIIASEMLKARRLVMRGLAHPILFNKELLEENPNMVEGDIGRVFGAVPVSGPNMYKLLARGDNIALYPGGAREALHRKGESSKLFWPDQPEFIKMAAKFGATVIPMCSVGVDELVELLLDFDEMASIPIFGDRIVEFYKQLPRVRANTPGEVGKQIPYMPVMVPRLAGPGRLYILFGQPIHFQGKQDYFRDRKNVNAAYLEVKSQVEAGLSYLLRKREEDPYRTFLPRMLYELASGGDLQAPTFKLHKQPT